MMSFYDTPLADLDAAIAADPGLGAAARDEGRLPAQPDRAGAGGRGRRRTCRSARDRVGAPRRRANAPTSKPCRPWLEGRWQAACRVWDELLVEHPRDALALQWAQLWDFYRGDADGAAPAPGARAARVGRSRPAVSRTCWRCTPSASRSATCTRRPRRSAAARWPPTPRVPWAVHAVAHVMEMQGRFEEGAAWLRQHQADWAEGNGFAAHLWWHKALFRLEALDLAGVLRLIDNHLRGDALQITLQRVDAAALLWRLHLLGERRRRAMRRAAAKTGTCPTRHAGHYAFNDVHAVLAMLGAGDVARAEAWVARCAERAMTPDDARRSNHGDGARGRPAADARPAGVGARPGRRRRRCAVCRARRGAALRRQPRAARPHRPDAAGGRAPRHARAASAARCSTNG